MSGKILSDSAFDTIVQSLSSIHHRANLTVHNVMLMHRIKELETEVKNASPVIVPEGDKQKDEKIVQLESELVTLRANANTSHQALAERVTDLTANVRNLTKSLDESKAALSKAEVQNSTLGDYLAQLEQKLAAAQAETKEVVREVEVIKEVEVVKEVVKTVHVPAESADSGIVRLDERRRIVDWLNHTNAGETVRALYGQKLAKLIDQGAYDK